jgi:3-deoxy-D-manno-octulosonate 8-phosphate phosphatase (KDO 8-P phosphatase)
MSPMQQTILNKAKAIKLLVLDVDGVLTDNTLYFSNHGNDIKGFNAADGLGMQMLQRTGVGIAIVTGLQSVMVSMRAKQLGIEHVTQNCKDKLARLGELKAQFNADYTQIAYAGDDFPDLAAIRQAGLGITVANGHPYIAQHADWQTQTQGGHGAVREICELIMQAQGTLQAVWESYL